MMTVGIGLLGTTLDAVHKSDRWHQWRPTIDLCRHPDLLFNRLELLYHPRFETLAQVVCRDIATVSPETEVRLHHVSFEDPWDFEEVYAALHDFALRYTFAPETEDYLVHITTGTHVAQICLFLLTESRHFPGRLVQSSPPRKAGNHPGEYRIIDLDLSKYDRLASRFREVRAEGLEFLKSGIETRNAAFNALIARIEEVAIASRAPLMLMGPTGAGKSALARKIYKLKKQRQKVEGEFVEVNCATLRGEGAMSALFGHVKGAFTGALNARPGLLRAAHRGLLFLDEIGELALDEQAMLLRAIEEGKFLPLGADREVESEFQLISGTNRDLHKDVAAGRFREDLLTRVNLWTFELPALRDRPEDIEPNLEYELSNWAQTQGQRVTFNHEARRLFLDFAVSSEALWLGNFRDFRAAVERMATLAASGRIHTEHVHEEITRLKRAWRRTDEVPNGDLLATYLAPAQLAVLDRFDQAQLLDVVDVCLKAKTLSEAGRTLFAHSRQGRSQINDADRLRKYLARFGLSWALLREQ